MKTVEKLLDNYKPSTSKTYSELFTSDNLQEVKVYTIEYLDNIIKLLNSRQNMIFSSINKVGKK